MKKIHIVRLTLEQRAELRRLAHAQTTPVATATRARILLHADAGEHGPAWTDEAIHQEVRVGRATIWRLRKCFATAGLEAALARRPTPPRLDRRTLDGEQEAHLIALACSSPPDGHARWTLRLLANRFAELECGVLISHELARRTLKKNDLKPHLKKQWCIPPQANAQFVWRMEDILDVYTRPYDPQHPLVCFDELPYQLLADGRPPLPAVPGKTACADYEYERKGVTNLFLWYEPLADRRHITVTERRTRIDWAHCIKDLVDVSYPGAERIVLVMDNLNTHTPASLYLAFHPAEAKRIADRLEIHYTPIHGSWLNMAEIELSVLERQCLDRRIPDQAMLTQEIAAWESDRNERHGTVRWQFTTTDARIRLEHLYPSIQS